jgi:LmbE family N-acetylglucosaminyl deacetylase
MKSNHRQKLADCAWSKLRNPATGLAAAAKASIQLRALLLVAHPDDETIGASAVMPHISDCTVGYLTDGAPLDSRFWSTAASSRADYASTRWREALSALALAGIRPARVHWLGGVDQDAIFDLPLLVTRFTDLLRQLQPQVVITHPYEGGHPDHDAASLVAHAAIEILQRDHEDVPELLELTSYHARAGKCETGEFLGVKGRSEGELKIVLSPQDRIRKERMLDCYNSQRLVLQSLRSYVERLRIGPAYDFTQPPHAGKLWYECLQWPMTGGRWRQLAARAAAQLRLDVCA